MLPRRPSYLPEARQFSQADLHTVQRPEGIDSDGSKGVKPSDRRRDTLEKYADVQVSPGSWYEKDLLTTNAVVLDGFSTLLRDSLGFPAHSILIDNWTNQYVRLRGVRRFIPPYSFGWVLNIPSGEQMAEIVLQSPSPQLTAPAAIAGEHLWIGWAEAFLPPATGYTLPAGIGGGTAGVITTLQWAGASTLEVSTTGAAAAITATLLGAAGAFTFITGFEITGLGATAGSTIVITVTGLTNTLSYDLTIPAGATTALTPLQVEYPYPIASSAANTNIVVNVPSFGAGNTSAIVVAHGFRSTNTF